MALGLAVGTALGAWLAGGTSRPMLAGGGDRSGESIVATGPVSVRYDEGTKVQIPEEALYFLDYKAGRLKATIPSFRTTTAGTTRHLDAFCERDLATDFGLDLDTWPRPRFLMTTGQLGIMGAGWAPLYVIETTTGKVGVYRVQQLYGVRNRLRLDLLQMESTDAGETTASVAPGLPDLPPAR